MIGADQPQTSHMRMSFRFVQVLAFAMLVVSNLIHADSFRCGRKIVRTGDSSGTLLRVCGEPLYREKGKARISSVGAGGNVSIERWHYKKSTRSLEHIIVIYQGKVREVIVGGR